MAFPWMHFLPRLKPWTSALYRCEAPTIQSSRRSPTSTVSTSLTETTHPIQQLEDAGMLALDGEVENISRLLTDDEVNNGMRTDARRRFDRSGVDAESLERDFVSYQVILIPGLVVSIVIGDRVLLLFW